MGRLLACVRGKALRRCIPGPIILMRGRFWRGLEVGGEGEEEAVAEGDAGEGEDAGVDFGEG